MRNSLTVLLTLAILGSLTSVTVFAAGPKTAAAKTTVLKKAPAQQVSFQRDEYPNTKLPMSTNVPVGSIYYDYLDKLDGMGYLKSMLYGTRPYARVDFARWIIEAREKAATKPTPAYLETMLTELEREFKPELDAWFAYAEGRKDQGMRGVKVHSVAAELAYGKFSQGSYTYVGPANASWQPFSANNNGRHYGHNTNLNLSGYASGNLGREVAVSVSPRYGWDEDNHLSGAFDEAYLASRVGIFKIEAGKQALDWGQGYTGKLSFSNNSRPLTMLKISSEARQPDKGWLHFLGTTRWTAFIGQLDGERTANGVHDFKHPYMVGVRSDYIYDNLSIGLARLSMLGGDGNAFAFSDTWDWLRGKNAYHNDKWDDQAGLDVKYRFPGLQIYAELYGEDQAGYLPSDLAYRGGLYFPQLTKDGRWDLRLEGAHTNNDWYVHGTYQSGWIYHHDIMGDAMGCDATKAYAGINHYLGARDTLGLNAEYTKLGEYGNLNPKVLQLWLNYGRKLNASDRLTAMLGWASLSDAGYHDNNDVKDKFVKLVWQRSY